MTFIAEVTTRAPHGWRSNYDFRFLLDLALDFGDWVAVNTDPHWGGSMELLGEVRRYMNRLGVHKPLLAKGAHPTDGDLRVALSVADHALVVGRWPSLPDDMIGRCIFEPAFEAQVPLAVRGFTKAGAEPRIVWNARDLIGRGSGNPLRPVGQLVARHSLPWVCQESFIRTMEDVDAAAQAFIVGTNLVGFLESEGKGLAEVVADA